MNKLYILYWQIKNIFKKPKPFLTDGDFWALMPELSTKADKTPLEWLEINAEKLHSDIKNNNFMDVQNIIDTMRGDLEIIESKYGKAQL